MGRAADESLRLIALRLGRSPLTISRELTLNTDQHDRWSNCQDLLIKIF